MLKDMRTYKRTFGILTHRLHSPPANFLAACGTFFLALTWFSLPPAFSAEETLPTDDTPTSPSPVPTAAPSREGSPEVPKEKPKKFSRVPLYQRNRPTWGAELSGTLNAFGNNALIAEQGTTPAYAIVLQAEYQPAFLQDYGILGIGPSLTVYPMSGVTTSILSVLAAGAQVRYQLRYFREQLIVPNIGYAAEYLRYAFSNGVSGGVVSKGPIFGVWVLLNFLEPSAAAHSYEDTGISRFYLILEGRNFAAQDSNITISGISYYGGLRFEF